MRLWELQPKQSAFVGEISNSIEERLATRLVEMGFEFGQEVYCVRRSPFKGPMIIRLGGTILAIERSITELILLDTKSISVI